MKAWQIVSDQGIDGLQLADLDSPEPGPGEVVVQVRANSINFRDLGMVTNPAARGVQYPRIPNSDGAGEVIAVGAGVQQWTPRRSWPVRWVVRWMACLPNRWC
jgi:NADPH:quinone reductase-like Zn-dependent oxidoreductase